MQPSAAVLKENCSSTPSRGCVVMKTAVAALYYTAQHSKLGRSMEREQSKTLLIPLETKMPSLYDA
jgi:hypothetical protein